MLFPGEDEAVPCRKIVAMNSLSEVHSYDLYHIHIMSFSSCNGYKCILYLHCTHMIFIDHSLHSIVGIN